MTSATDTTLRDHRDETERRRQVNAASMHETHRQRLLWTLGAALVATIAIHHATYASMVGIWLRSDTFLHGILIFPISGYLVWRRWPELRTIDAGPFYPGVLAVAAASLAWWLSDFLGIQVGKQLMAVAMLPLVVLSLAGPAFTRAIAFPLGYLAFAVPFGEGAIPYLIDFTAFFTVEALQITGFPVLREGAFFSIPSGHFEVAKACSGIRYLLASLAIGTLYGYMIFRSLRKRLAFFAFALLLPIVANGLRAYGIVLIAHYSEMKLAVGVDHLIFGWVFFGVVMILMFWVGDRFRDRPVTAVGDDVDEGAPETDTGRRGGPPVLAAALVLLVAGAAPALAYGISRLDPGLDAAALPAVDAWRAVPAPTDDWRPNYIGASHERLAGYERGERRVDLAIVRYDSQRQGGELANVMNTVADDEEWRIGRVEMQRLPLGGEVLSLRETSIHRGGETRLVWSWHEVNGEPVVGDLDTKLRELISVVTLDLPVSAAVVVSTRVADDEQAARDTLTAFLETSRQPIHDCLYAVAGGTSACLGDGMDARPEEVSGHDGPAPGGQR